MLDIFCPAKVVVSRPGEKPWVTEEIKILKRRVQRQYERKGQSPKYLELKCSYDAKMKAEAQKYTEKDVRNGDRNSSYAALRRLGVRPGENTANSFTLPGHDDSNLSAQQSAEIIADHFAAISQNYDPISVNNFPPTLRQALTNPNMSAVPY